MEPKRLSIVIPVHNEAANVRPLVDRLCRAAGALVGWAVDVVFVDDGSTDATVAGIEALRADGLDLGLVRLSRNFGHQAALEAGLSVARGDAVVTMDGDLQHPPERIPDMVTAFEAGADVVHMVRNRPTPGGKGVLSRSFYRLFKTIAHSEIVPDAADFRLVSRRVVEVLLRIPEREKFLRGLIPSLGFRQTVLAFDEGLRQGGEPSYDFLRSFRLARKALLDFSTVPLQLVFWLGLGLAAASFLFGLGHLAWKLLAWQRVAPGFTDLITAILFLSGCLLAAVGVLGRYLILILEQVRGRPAFVVMDSREGRPLPAAPSSPARRAG